jgi:GTPase SAR1 family protein|eukprot:evm.model.NODE_37006_length_97105_cov_39.404202.18
MNGGKLSNLTLMPRYFKTRLWRHYYKDNDALIFVIDSADRARLSEAKEELLHLLAEPQLLDSILLVYANKADLPHAISVQEMAHFLQLDSVG